MSDNVAAFLNAAETAGQTITLFSIVWALSACPEAPTTDPFKVESKWLLTVHQPLWTKTGDLKAASWHINQ
jgi:hypothetical protein